MLLCPPKVPCGEVWGQSLASAVGVPQPTAWPVARLSVTGIKVLFGHYFNIWFVTERNEVHMNFSTELPICHCLCRYPTQYLLSRSSGSYQVLCKSELTKHMLLYICILKGVRLKSKLQQTWTWSIASWLLRQHVLSPTSILPALSFRYTVIPTSKSQIA